MPNEQSTNNQETETTHFGYQRVTATEKTQKVSAVFDTVARRYDIMNDLMSFGLHRLWKRFALSQARVRPGQVVLDLAGGTGDLAKSLAESVGNQGLVILADINNSMLQQGRDRLIDEGMVRNINYVQADAENLPFAENSFDCITIAFGLRNVTHISTALESMYRVLKPGGRLLVLEFSKPYLSLLQPLYDAYSFKVLPLLGKVVAGDAESYQYLAESIRMHPDQKTLLRMMEQAEFDDCEYFNLTGGIVALHRGIKF
jgi:demethylmenaquinone methyltransferase/2-methoxy-6-polyprenyl-1,4-benzoquinol methylase